MKRAFPRAVSEGIPVESRCLVSFDGRVRRRESVARLDRYRQIEQFPADALRTVRGGGYSYAPASFGAGTTVQEARAFTRVLHFDPENGTLECEAGLTLGQLHSVATPHGWYLPAQPGYPLITLGGCIATEAHGKNHFRDGTFRRRILALDLFHPAHGVLRLTRERHADLFELTCGGLGLTGQILSATLALDRLEGSRVEVRRIPLGRLEEAVPLLEEWAPKSRFLYTWHNLSVSGASFGRGFLYTGDFRSGSGPARDGGERFAPITAEDRGRFRISLLNRATTAPFNAAYELVQRASSTVRELSLFEFLFPVARKVAYFELFGSRGLHEYQMLVPVQSFGDLAATLRRGLARFGVPIALASCKLFKGERSLLRFDGTGICLALDFPSSSRSERLAEFLDRVVREAGGLPNIVKDSRLPRETVEACYPEVESFRRSLRAFDPLRLYRSEISERLAL
ncbi:MAG TPA: FAD-binding oxidoreductase [Thermoanaerobaculia bacterium]|jgi:decaprenylphospho-beta-D-ribofuranose 2-oxidase